MVRTRCRQVYSGAWPVFVGFGCGSARFWTECFSFDGLWHQAYCIMCVHLMHWDAECAYGLHACYFLLSRGWRRRPWVFVDCGRQCGQRECKGEAIVLPGMLSGSPESDVVGFSSLFSGMPQMCNQMCLVRTRENTHALCQGKMLRGSRRFLRPLKHPTRCPSAATV